MKKLLSLAMVLCLLALALTACGSPAKTNLNYGKECLAVATQLDALNGLVKGDADIVVMDSVMAGYYMNSVDTFKDYQILENVVLAEEKYGIAAKKTNEALVGKVNEAIIALADTEYKTIADAYGLTSELLVTASTANPYATATDGSWDKVAQDKKVIIGYTLFAPIAFKEGDGADAPLKGFDIDLARAVFAYLNETYSTEVAVEFVIIDWDQKETMLENGSIDLVWNGMTINPDRESMMCISVPYMANKQAVVIKKTDAEKYASADAAEFATKAAEAVIILEKGSAAEAIVDPVE